MSMRCAEWGPPSVRGGRRRATEAEYTSSVSPSSERFTQNTRSRWGVTYAVGPHERLAGRPALVMGDADPGGLPPPGTELHPRSAAAAGSGPGLFPGLGLRPQPARRVAHLHTARGD